MCVGVVGGVGEACGKNKRCFSFLLQVKVVHINNKMSEMSQSSSMSRIGWNGFGVALYVTNKRKFG